jgi:hypothetical protein
LNPDSCANYLRIDLIDKKDAVMEIEEFMIK